jgi:radical S-adenosyl methionine domain-containing protein 2
METTRNFTETIKQMNMKTKIQIPSVNFHLWEPCNFNCKYCFAAFQDVRKTILPKGHLSKEKALELVNELAGAGFSKITFAGGEPTLCPWIEDLIVTAKTKGLVTMIVTNSTRINENFLNKVGGYLDWVVFSIDSTVPAINKEVGRHQGVKIIPDQNFYFEKRKWLSSVESN